MRTFNKFLALSLAAALTITAVPITSQTAKAATSPSLSAGDKTIYVGKTYNYNIKNKVAKSTYVWTTSNKTVATVNTKDGVVTAKKAGTAIIQVVITLPNKKKVTSKATVTVKESATSVEISNAEEGTVLSIGSEVFDYNRILKTKSGGSSTDKTYWYITEDTAGTTIDGSGVVSTSKPGSFQLQAKTATSKAQKDKGIFTAESSVLSVQVPFTITSKLKATNQVQLNMNYKIDNLNKEDIEIATVSGKHALNIKNLEIASDGLSAVATVDTQFVDGTAYTITVPQFTQSTSFTATIGGIASIVLEDQIVAPGVPTTVKYKILDSNGIDVTQNYPFNRLQFTFSIGEIDPDGKITLTEKGSSTFFKVKYLQNDSSGKDTTITSNQAKITAVETSINSILKWTTVESGKAPDYDNANHTIAIGESGRRLYFQFKNTFGDIIDTYKKSTNLTFTSLNTSIIGVDIKTGILYPYKTGSATIRVSDGTFTSDITINVAAARIPTALSSETTTINLSSQTGIAETANIRFDLKDQYGNNMSAPAYENPTVKVAYGDEGIVTVSSSLRPVTKLGVFGLGTAINAPNFTLEFKARSKGSSTIHVTYAGKTQIINVTVSEPGPADHYLADLSLKVIDPNVINENSTVLSIYEVDKNNVKRKVIHEGSYVIKDSTGKEVLSSQRVNLDGRYDGELINSSILALPDGVYTVVVTLGPVETSTSFTVKSSKPAANVTLKRTSLDVLSSDDIYSRIMECLTVTVNDTDVTPFLSNALIEFTSFNTGFLPSQTVSKNSNRFAYAGYNAAIKVTKITFTFGSINYTITPNVDLSFNVR